MEGQIEELQQANTKKYLLPTAVSALIVFAAIGFYLYKSNVNDEKAIVEQSLSGQTQVQESSSPIVSKAVYRNGVYTQTGNYVSPGGPREVNVTITLTDGAITEATAQGTATDATSKRFQGEFVANFKSQVVGKNINEVVLTKVSGSSLTPKGFNDALDKIKAAAKA